MYFETTFSLTSWLVMLLYPFATIGIRSLKVTAKLKLVKVVTPFCCVLSSVIT